MQTLAPAKINLHLRVAPPRTDGFHPLITWMTTIGLFDTLTLKQNTGEVEMTCGEPSLPCDDRNLVVKAAKLLRRSPGQSVLIHLEKQIPHGGGLGGGSSDAASTLVALNQYWKLGNDVESLADLAAQLGSDVPFFLFGPSSICKGRGELIQPIRSPSRAKWVLLVLPDVSMPTPAVYQKFDAMDAGKTFDTDPEPDWNQWAALPSKELLPRLINDLEAPAFAIEPRLASLRDSIEKTADRPVRMSGSGSSLFTLYDDREDAIAAATLVTQRHSQKALAVELAPVSR
jgi:4-diphosphocytidyl-2-C-methyl-D-erythritol kinase